MTHDRVRAVTQPLTSLLWRHRLTWRHQWPHHSILSDHFPIIKLPIVDNPLSPVVFEMFSVKNKHKHALARRTKRHPGTHYTPCRRYTLGLHPVVLFIWSKLSFRFWEWSIWIISMLSIAPKHFPLDICWENIGLQYCFSPNWLTETRSPAAFPVAAIWRLSRLQPM